jgi:hypothetical protein
MVMICDQVLDGDVQVGELFSEGAGDLGDVDGASDDTGFAVAERREGVFVVALGNDFLDGGKICAVEDVLEEASCQLAERGLGVAIRQWSHVAFSSSVDLPSIDRRPCGSHGC